MPDAGVLAFVRDHGVVLASAKGPVPSVAEFIAGEAVRGSWWSHPAGKHIFAALREVQARDDVLACRVIGGKQTFVHARLWPALVRCADRFAPEHLAWSREVHTASGKHVRIEVSYPEWVPAHAMSAAAALDEREALRALGEWAAR